jgi:hypothetical protein
MYILKFDSTGILQWGKTIGGPEEDYASSIIQTTDGGYVVAGSTASFGVGAMDVYLVKLDGSGSLLWSKTVGRPNCDACSSFALTEEGGYILVGNTDNSCTSGYSDMYIVKLDADVNTCGNSTLPATSTRTGGILGSSNPTITSPTPTITTPAPLVDSGGSLITFCVIGIQPISNKRPDSYKLYQNYPNPFNPVTRIKFSLPNSSGSGTYRFVSLIIYDVLGKEIASLIPLRQLAEGHEGLSPGTYEVEWDGTNYASGVYYYCLINNEYKESKKMLLIK